MKLSIKEIENITIIKLYGNVLGGPDATELTDTLHQLLDKKKRKIIVDLSGVESMNSSGLSMLIGALTAVRNAGGFLKIAEASKKIESLLIVTKLTSVFELYPTVKKAISSFK